MLAGLADGCRCAELLRIPPTPRPASILIGRSSSSCRFHPAASSMSWAACWRKSCRRISGSDLLHRESRRRRRKHRHVHGATRGAGRLYNLDHQLQLPGEPRVSKVPYDPLGFEAITISSASPSVLLVHPSNPAKTVKELVDLIRKEPGKHGYASPGTGSPLHLQGEMFKGAFGLDMTHVPFAGRRPRVAVDRCGPHADCHRRPAARHSFGPGRQRTRTRHLWTQAHA